MSVCVLMAKLALPMDQARRRGVTSFQVQQAIAEQHDPQAREIARAVAWYVYTANDDSGLTSKQLAAQVRRSCEASQ